MSLGRRVRWRAGRGGTTAAAGRGGGWACLASPKRRKEREGGDTVGVSFSRYCHCFKLAVNFAGRTSWGHLSTFCHVTLQ